MDSIYIINNRWTTRSIYTAIRMACKIYATTHQEMTVIEAIKPTTGGQYKSAYRIMHISADGLVDDEQIAL